MRFQLDVHDLVNRGLVTRKYDEATGLYVLKYKNSVFFNNLWGVDDRLLECRGTVVDEDYNVISRPFTKVFNYKENGTNLDAYTHVMATRKVNGFLGVLTAYKGEPLFSTTGSLSGKYVDLARDVITKQFGGEQRVRDFLLHERTRSVMSAKNSSPEDMMGSSPICLRFALLTTRTLFTNTPALILLEQEGITLPNCQKTCCLSML